MRVSLDFLISSFVERIFDIVQNKSHYLFWYSFLLYVITAAECISEIKILIGYSF